MSGLGTKMAGGRPRKADGDRPEDDFYQTEPEVTLALLLWLIEYDLIDVTQKIWEPCCGNGAIVKVLERYCGDDVIATNLYERGFGKTGVDFLKSKLLADQIITNPPFHQDFPDRFIRRVFELGGVRLLCLMLKATYWHAGPGIGGRRPRNDLWNMHKPSAVLAITWRPDFTGQGQSTMDCCWNVWISGDDRFPAGNLPVYDRLKRPENPDQMNLFSALLAGALS